MQKLIDDIIKDCFDDDVIVLDYQMMGGGCINHGARVRTDEGEFFLKWSQNPLEMFEMELDGLELLKKSTRLTTPNPIKVGYYGRNSYLLMDYIHPGAMKSNFWGDFGSGLAELHRVTHDSFGLDKDNYIGSLEQYNEHRKGWVDFFAEMRIAPQLKMARDTRKIDSSIQQQFEVLINQLPEIIPVEPPSLIHGDLWSGNFLTDSSGSAAIIDPAVYYGHREIEISFTRLFGGFDSNFYKAYHESYPLEPGFEDRIDIHNLYPLLVHVNLFGTSYLSGIITTLRRFN